MKRHLLLSIALAFAFLYGCAQEDRQESRQEQQTQNFKNNTMKEAIFGGGCFWCTEAIFDRTKGVHKVEPGYAGGERKNPTYEQVASGATGHAEVVKVTYNPDEISYNDLLLIFFKTHDPTTLNRQGADVGPQYRSAVFYTDEEQKRMAEEMIQKLEKEQVWKDPIVTEVSPAKNFTVAEDYHHDYYENNKNGNPYCQVVINPKLNKFKAQFQEFYKKQK